MEMLK